ncbi:hypothetical protein BO78DRAFT_447936 [Aspergillus sclerotiicarbonarius CBS 121057]|uniref:SnoaL-like domain-containing protein n=1 Tax=Aspergillus sclerotiicarbonarius (strain CBS 121057 / IBT 28362) TaxID=1448318 RepID=A0A319ENB2_ASPSB|nr:hypothetical protein BO78DRAFT_447936 [Aspergillus sclerotiicarbonarius CBS 121057]
MSSIAQMEKVPWTGKPSLFNFPDKGGYTWGAEPPLAFNRLTYNTDDASTLERFKIRELCEGWPLHRDACEWTDLREIFDLNAFINISWQQNYRDKAIETWAEGWAKGDFICHRVLGHAVDIKGDRAIDKMKVTISWRFADGNGVEWDSDCDCRFVFFLEKQPHGWKILCNHPIYEKDKLVPVDATRLPTIDHESLAKEPKGYQFLAYGMRRLGYPIKQNLPQLFGKERDALYQEMIEWLDGKDIDFSQDNF